MLDLKELYQQIIVDHSQHPHNFCILKKPNCTKEGYNPLCGDKIILYINKQNGIITDICFQGSGCAIATASTSMMTDAIKGKNIDEVLKLFTEFLNLVTTGKTKNAEKLGKLMVFACVAKFPMRIKCATLAWHTLKSALLAKI